MSNQQAFLRFKELLETRQAVQDPTRDIREHVLSLTNKKVGFGYVTNTLTTSFGANLRNLFSNAIAVDRPEVSAADAYLALGTVYQEAEKSHKGAMRLFNAAPPDKEIILFESAFLATTHSWAHSFQEGNPAYACLGYVYDDIAHYFMADYPNRIIQKLNSAEAPNAAELKRAQGLMTRITRQRISKYNAQPMIAPAMTEGYSRRVLVCDQAYADASTIYGKVGDAEFEQMLLAAIRENPDAEILVKTHPDSVWDKNDRKGYYSHLQSTGRVRMLREPVNPYVLFDLVDTVYVGTSQMGFEALLAGKKVVTFGMPFYAGWGLTDDRQKIPHRQRRRSLDEIFHYFYIWYTIYNMPGKEGPAEIEDVLSYIEQNRPYPLPPSEAELAAPPKVSIIIPVHGVEAYIEECLASVQRQTLREIEIIPINDASPDGSQAIIDRLAAEDGRIRPIILSENIGQGFARNKGLEQAAGEYIWFLDSDDWLVDADFLERTVAAAQQNGADMTRAKKAGEAIFDATDTLQSIKEDVTERFFETNVPVTDYRSNPDILHSRHFCLWLYRRKFLDDHDIRFVTTQWEERSFLLKALLLAKTISLTTNRCFMYRIRLNSTARREKRLEDVERFLQNIEQICALLHEHGARDPNDALRLHLNFQLSQFIHILFFGFWYRTLIQKASETHSYYRRLSAALELVNFRGVDVTDSPEVVRKENFSAGIYQLIVSALRAGRFDWLDLAVNSASLPQAQLYDALLTPPETEAEADFQAALSRYARNERVLSTPLSGVAAPASKPRIVIHIGATKTGSTFLQHMLEKNRPALLRQGIWFPEVGLFWQPTRPRKQAGHVGFTRAAAHKDTSLRDYIDRGLALMGGKVHTIVLSSEAYFLQENAPRLADYFAGYQIEMVAYLRRQDEWANSQYCEFVSGGAVGRVDVPISDWLQQPAPKRQLDYLGMLQKWEAKIGRSNIHVRVFDRSAFVDGDLLSDFAQATDLPQLLALPRPTDSDQNEARLSAAHVEVIRLYNKRPFVDQNGYFDFIEEVGTAIGDWRREQGLATPKPWLLRPEQADTLMAESAKANTEIARRYLEREDGILFGPHSAQPEPSPIYPQEMALIEEIYQRYTASPGDENQKFGKPLKPEKHQNSGQEQRLEDRGPALQAADGLIRNLETEREMLQGRLAHAQEALARLEGSRGYRLAKKLWRLRAAFSRRRPA